MVGSTNPTTSFLLVNPSGNSLAYDNHCFKQLSPKAIPESVPGSRSSDLDNHPDVKSFPARVEEDASGDIADSDGSTCHLILLLHLHAGL